MSQELAEVVCARYKAEGTDSEKILFLSGLRNHLQKLDNDRTSDVLERMNYREVDLDFEGMVTSKKITTLGIRARLQKMQRFCKDASEVVSTTIAKVVELACEGIETKRRSAKLTNRTTDMEARFVEATAAKSTSHGQLEAVERQVAALKGRLANAGLAMKK